MFTGIVEELGIIQSLNMQGTSGSIRIQAKKVLENTKIGDSIAVNGICLTVTSMTGNGFTADIMAETVRRSGLKEARTGDAVNLERAMAADGRFGGHIVSGHIDGTGVITEYRKEENAVWVTISAQPEILTLIVEKGSICIDGISLTVATVSDTQFQVSVIPHTAEETTLLHKGVGNMVNLENDIVGKYVQKLLGLAGNMQESTADSGGGLTMEMLQDLGY
ncbi:MAG: riboflavin synthase [Lachnospiraceae bacterium]|nr:riboflavin synthase [Lachnospiraceae bacterium]